MINSLGLPVFLVLASITILLLGQKSSQADPSKPSVKFSGTVQGMYDRLPMNTGNSLEEWKIKRALLSTTVSLNRWFKIRTGVNMASQRIIRDAYMNIIFSNHVELKAGQMKLPFSREELNPSSQLLVVDRGETNGLFGSNYYQSWDLGGTIICRSSNDRIHMDMGIFNGQGANKPRDNNNGKAIAGRIIVKPRMNLEIAAGTVHNSVSVVHGDIGLTEWVNAYEGDYHLDLGNWILEGEYRRGDNWRAGKGIAMVGVQQFLIYHYPVNRVLLRTIEPGIKVEYLDQDKHISGKEAWYYIPYMGFYLLDNVRFQMNIIQTMLRSGSNTTKFVAQVQYKFL